MYKILFGDCDMKYTFKDFDSNELFQDNLRVLIVTGNYAIFNSMVCDRVRSMCKGEPIKFDEKLLADFGIKVDNTNAADVNNTLDLESFIGTINVVPYSGKWYCNTPISLMTKKQKEWFKSYIKNPSDNGILVLQSMEYKEFSEFLRDRTISQSKNVHIIQLSFPDRPTLYKIVEDKFREHGVGIQRSEIETFVFRMSNAYDDYDRIIDKICSNIEVGQEITKKELLDGLHGINNCVIDDFIERLLIPFKTDTPSNRKVIFHMLGALMEEYGAQGLCNKLLKQVNMYILFRQEINKGNIPVLVRYSLNEVKNRLGENHPLNKVSDFRFRRQAFIASRTSLKDWVYIKLILESATYYNQRSFEEALYRITVRSILNQNMLNYDIKIGSIRNQGMQKIDSIPYDESLLKKARELETEALNKLKQQ